MRWALFAARTLGRWANDAILPNLGMKSQRHTFNSLWHTVVTHLSQAGVEQPIVQALVGRQEKGVTQGYFGLVASLADDPCGLRGRPTFVETGR